MEASRERTDRLRPSESLELFGECQGDPRGEAPRLELGDLGAAVGSVMPDFFKADRENLGVLAPDPAGETSGSSGYSS